MILECGYSVPFRIAPFNLFLFLIVNAGVLALSLKRDVFRLVCYTLLLVKCENIILFYAGFLCSLFILFLFFRLNDLLFLAISHSKRKVGLHCCTYFGNLRTRVRYHVADIFHSGQVHDAAFKGVQQNFVQS